MLHWKQGKELNKEVGDSINDQDLGMYTSTITHAYFFIVIYIYTHIWAYIYIYIYIYLYMCMHMYIHHFLGVLSWNLVHIMTSTRFLHTCWANSSFNSVSAMPRGPSSQGMNRNDLKSSIFNALDQAVNENRSPLWMVYNRQSHWDNVGSWLVTPPPVTNWRSLFNEKLQSEHGLILGTSASKKEM